MVINVQNKILHNLLPILNTLHNGVIPAARHSKTKKFFICFAMRSPCTTLLREVRLRLGTAKQKNAFLFCYALALH